MGKRGPRRQPAELKLARGTYRADKQGSPAEMPQYDRIVSQGPPESLGTAGRERWESVCSLLTQANVLTVPDLRALETYCRAFDEVAKCDEDLKGGQWQCSDKGHLTPHPAVNARFRWLEIIRRYEQEFGLTPSARSGVQTVAPKKQSGVQPRARA